MKTKNISAIPISSIPVINAGDDIVELIINALEEMGMDVMDNDVFVIASKVVSKTENRIVKAADVKVSERAIEIAERNKFDPVHVELALLESDEVIRSDGVLITETHSGLICNFSGVDKSNVPDGEYILLPNNPDKSAADILSSLMKETGKTLAVIISDTQGRPWRKGSINVAIGCAGINAFKHNKGKRDLQGRVLKRSTVCQVDEITSLTEPLMGQAGERVPVVIVRGYEYQAGEENAKDIVRSKEDDLFR
ncbi:MAG: coenzyme F420-0:L-glutamate ligase [Candidatus Thorarchaeota archaeon]